MRVVFPSVVTLYVVVRVKEMITCDCLIVEPISNSFRSIHGHKAKKFTREEKRHALKIRNLRKLEKERKKGGKKKRRKEGNARRVSV